MIRSITFKFGAAISQEILHAELAPITIFVGPNNSGKSRVLQEIENYCKTGVLRADNVILQNLNLTDTVDYEAILTAYSLIPKINEYLDPEQIVFGNADKRFKIKKEHILQFLKDPNQFANYFCPFYLALNTTNLTGANRQHLVNMQAGGNLKELPTNSLQVLFGNNKKRGEVRRIIYDAFKKYFVIDPTHSGHLHIRLSDTCPRDEMQERGLHDDAVEFHKNALDIASSSDGVKAFTGIITTIIANEPKVMLIDEPEAFLHPSLAYKLGKEIGNTFNDKSRNLFVSTHSSNFLMGCIQSGVPLNIIRLTYSNYSPTARILQNDKVLKLMRHPLLRSTGVLNGLFYEYVIVTEGDSDRAFYQEINERLLTFEPTKGIPNCLFLNAQNKQTIHEILGPLRAMGIPCVAIVDVDIIKEGGQVWSRLLESANVPQAIIESTNQLRATVIRKIKESQINFKTNGGVQILSEADREECNHLFDQLNTYGLFPVRNGELESWLKFLEVSTGKHGTNWLIEIFEKLGEDPTSSSYVKPQDNDVWDFINSIKGWLDNPVRKGIVV